MSRWSDWNLDSQKKINTSVIPRRFIQTFTDCIKTKEPTFRCPYLSILVKWKHYHNQ